MSDSKGVSVPAVCKTCFAVFPSSIALQLPNSGGVSFEGVAAGPCPVCGGMGEIADGTFRVMGETVRRLTDGLSIPEILQLKRVVEAARKDHADIEAVTTEIAATPELAAFAAWMQNYFTPKSGGDLFGYLSFLLSLIGLILAMQPPISEPPSQLTQDQVHKITVQAMRDAFAEAQQNSSKVSKTEQMRRKKAKVGRNDPCPCMSGKKHKKCCI